MTSLHRTIYGLFLVLLVVSANAGDVCNYIDACTKAKLTGLRYGMLIDECKSVFKIDGECKLKYVGKIV